MATLVTSGDVRDDQAPSSRSNTQKSLWAWGRFSQPHVSSQLSGPQRPTEVSLHLASACFLSIFLICLLVE